MRHITYAYLGPEEAAAKFGKKGTASDITLWNAKTSDAHLNLVTATRFPEKLQSLLLTLDMCDEVVLHPGALDRAFGETVVACDLLGKTKGFLRGTPQVALEQSQDLLKKTALKDLTGTDDADAVLREALYQRADTPQGGALVLPVDHSFPVKGVGTVVLGLVRSGEVLAHQTLQIFPTAKSLEVRTIQVHDVDQQKAGPRSRVGLAVKNAEPEDVKRGTILAPPGSLKVLAADTMVKATLRLHPFSKWQPRAGAALHAFHVLQDVVLRVEAATPAVGGQSNLDVRLEGPVALVPGSPIVLLDIDNKAQRLIGRLEFA